MDSTSALEAARALAPAIRESAIDIDKARRLPRAPFEAIADAGIFHMAVPKAIGGSEIDFPGYVRVIEELGKADALIGHERRQRPSLIVCVHIRPIAIGFFLDK